MLMRQCINPPLRLQPSGHPPASDNRPAGKATIAITDGPSTTDLGAPQKLTPPGIHRTKPGANQGKPWTHHAAYSLSCKSAAYSSHVGVTSPHGSALVSAAAQAADGPKVGKPAAWRRIVACAVWDRRDTCGKEGRFVEMFVQEGEG
jgi:hypothetical protein